MNTEWPILFFPNAVVLLLIVGALAMTGLAALTLIIMLIVDTRKRSTW